jgi:hypothetical protein
MRFTRARWRPVCNAYFIAATYDMRKPRAATYRDVEHIPNDNGHAYWKHASAADVASGC